MTELAETSLIISGVFVVIGLVCLTYGGDVLAKGAASLALNLNVNPVVIGLTVVSIATSMPELFAAMFAALHDPVTGSDLAIGNILGSNLGNIGLIMGVTALIYPIHIQKRLIIKEMPILLAATLVFSAACFNGIISRIDAGLLILGMVGYLYYMVRSAKQGEPAMLEEALEEVPSKSYSVWASVGFVLLGSVLLAVGAKMLVDGAVNIAQSIGVSNSLIGLTLVAIGTSLPELSASIAAARQKQSSLCAGNIVGSNIFNILFVGGAVSAVVPLKVDSALFAVHFPAMLLLTALLWLIYTTDKRVTRLEGVTLLIVYALIIYLCWEQDRETMSAMVSAITR